MPDNRFIDGRQLALSGNNYGAPSSVAKVTCVAGTSSYTPFPGWDNRVEVVRVFGYMTGAGASSDTVKVTDGTNDVTDTVDLSSLSDTDVFEVGQMDDAYVTVEKASSITVTTASDATCVLFVEVIRA